MLDMLSISFSDPPELLVFGCLMLVGWLAHWVGSFTHIPRITILLLFGILAGPSFLDLIPTYVAELFPQVTHFALAMVGFLLGESFAGREIKDSGAVVLAISIGETLFAALAVFMVVLFIQGDVIVALLLAGIAPASAPAATLDVIRQYRAKGPLARTVLGVVAIDDAWGVIVFSFLLVLAELLSAQQEGAMLIELGSSLWEVLGAIVVGVVCGLPMAKLTGRIKKGEPSILEAAGFVFVCGGLAQLLDVSYLLSCIVLGATVANRAKHHTRPFRDIEGAIQPFLVIFFLLAGYECDVTVLQVLGLVGAGYIIARTLGLVAGGTLAAYWVRAPRVVRTHVGWCLLPQAGVALGLALLVSERLPAYGEAILPLIVATTMVFEIIGPLVTRYHLKLAGEID